MYNSECAWAVRVRRFVSGVMITVSVHELIPQAVEVAPVSGILGMLFGGALVKIGLVAIGSSSH